MRRVNKLKIALVTDSTSVLTKQEVSDNNITVVPIPIIVGDKEAENGTISVRTRTGGDEGAMSVEDFIEKLSKEVSARAK